MNRITNFFTVTALSLTCFVAISFSTQGLAQSNDRAKEMITKLKGKKPKFRSAPSDPKVFYAPVSSKTGKTRGAAPMKAFFSEGRNSVENVTAPTQNPYSDSKGDLGIQSGAPAYKVTYDVDESSLLKGEIFFMKGKAMITRESYPFLKDLALALNSPELQNYKFIIEGHASAEGDAISNKWLSQERADAIFHILVNQYHVRPHQIYPAGFGEDQARYDAHSLEWQLAKDRRVLIYKLKY